MRVLAVDVGTGTQDILLFDSGLAIENCPKMVMPSPTARVAKQIRQAARESRDVLLTGTNMGGGPCTWAVREHLKAGCRVFATPEAAQTMDDDLAEVQRWGVVLVSEGEAARTSGAQTIELRDFDYPAIGGAFARFGVELAPDVLAVAVLDHGCAPPGVSDRQFRFQLIREMLRRENTLTAFAYRREEILPELTRMRAVASSVEADHPLLVMDTPAAAALGCLDDEEVQAQSHLMVINLGNSHALAFHLLDRTIVGLFEHHTDRLSREKLEWLVDALGRGELTNEQVFADQGHGALVVDSQVSPPTFWAVTGPRRGLLRDSPRRPRFAVPHGDVMLAGCFGLVRAVASKFPAWAEEIEAALRD